MGERGRERERREGEGFTCTCTCILCVCVSMIIEVHIHVHACTHGMQETDMPLGTVVIANTINSLTDLFKWHDIFQTPEQNTWTVNISLSQPWL